jgi:CHASE3 domain sensor protein
MQQGGAASVVTLLILLFVGVLTGSTVTHLRDKSRGAVQAERAKNELSSFITALDEAEAGKRGFVITGDDEHLEVYRAGKDAAARELQRLHARFADHPIQRPRVDELELLMADRMREMLATIEVRRQGGFEAAAALVRENRGRRAMARIRQLVAEMKTYEHGLSEQREAEMDATVPSFLRSLGLAGICLALWCAMAVIVISKGVAKRLLDGIKRIRSASTELQATANQQVKGAKDQVSAATEVAVTVRQLVSTSRMIADSAQRVTRVASDTTAAARSGAQTVESAQEAVEAVRGQVDRIVDHMLDLGKRSQEIGGILDIINDLAEQTNILAINATVEAAGAGEAGRRFGVVASEIRKLADRVGGSTKEIRRLIEEIRAAANTTVMATEDGAKAAEAGARRFVDVTASLRHIVELVDDTAQAAREIELSTKQQTSAMEQVSSAVGDVAQTARESELGTAQTVATAAELATLSDELRLIVSRT